jgi:hypothetical protein
MPERVGSAEWWRVVCPCGEEGCGAPADDPLYLTGEQRDQLIARNTPEQIEGLTWTFVTELPAGEVRTLQPTPPRRRRHRSAES